MPASASRKCSCQLGNAILNKKITSLQTLIAAVDAPSNIASKLQIEGHAIIANQCSENASRHSTSNSVIYVNSQTKGIGVNRNLALLYASKDVVLFGDDDMKYRAGYSEVVLNAFNEIPDADLIVFNLDYKNSPVKNTRRQSSKIKRVRIWNSLNYGAPRMAIRLSSQRKANIWFTTLFGGGAIYGAGEDCLFMLSALRHGLKVFAYPETIAETDLTSSSWFSGYGDKFFFDKGALFQAAFGAFSLPMMLQFIARHRDTWAEYSAWNAFKFMRRGGKAFQNTCASFEECQVS